MAHTIVSIDPGSPAERAGLMAGDRLTHLRGELVVDFLDYQALTAYRKVKVRVLRDGQELEVTLRKDEYEPTGMNFSQPMMSNVRMCCNHCLFCFVDQLPKNVRPSLCVKDDDWRMSLMMGNYVTLTNLDDRGIDRIIRRNASPLYISVHCSDPELRVKLLRTPRAAMIQDQLRRLSDGGIRFHCQSVLCPGLNDGDALEETLEFLTGLPGALSLALVPVGLTNHREGLCDLRKYTREEARAVIAQAERWREKLLKERGTRFVFPSDEFYLQGDVPVPEDEAYEDYGQIDDGVGLLRLLDTEFRYAWEELKEEERVHTDGKKIAIACGVSAADWLRDMVARYPVRGTDIRVYAIENRFFGSNVTVSGLITGGDLTSQMADRDCEHVLITECMLRDGENCFLDDMTLDQAIQKLGRPIMPVGRRGEDLLDAILAARDA